MKIASDYFDKEIDNYGETISVVNISNRSYDKWGEETYSKSTTSVTAIVDYLGDDMELMQEGRFQPDDKSFFLKADTTVSKGDLVIYDSSTYIVDDVFKGRSEGSTYVIEARAKKE